MEHHLPPLVHARDALVLSVLFRTRLGCELGLRSGQNRSLSARISLMVSRRDFALLSEQAQQHLLKKLTLLCRSTLKLFFDDRARLRDAPGLLWETQRSLLWNYTITDNDSSPSVSERYVSRTYCC